ncbi:MAG: hypothetical protein ACOYIQ_04755 [Christensenellales bacterium]
MLVNQISVFLENRSGRIKEFAEALYKAGIKIVAMNIADTTDYGILRVITDNNPLAVEVLKKSGFNIASTDLIGIEVDNSNGIMKDVLQILDEEDININYLYTYIKSDNHSTIILFKVDDVEKTLEKLKERNINLANIL